MIAPMLLLALMQAPQVDVVRPPEIPTVIGSGTKDLGFGWNLDSVLVGTSARERF